MSETADRSRPSRGGALLGRMLAVIALAGALNFGLVDWSHAQISGPATPLREPPQPQRQLMQETAAMDVPLSPATSGTPAPSQHPAGGGRPPVAAPVQPTPVPTGDPAGACPPTGWICGTPYVADPLAWERERQGRVAVANPAPGPAQGQSPAEPGGCLLPPLLGGLSEAELADHLEANKRRWGNYQGICGTGLLQMSPAQYQQFLERERRLEQWLNGDRRQGAVAPQNAPSPSSGSSGPADSGAPPAAAPNQRAGAGRPSRAPTGGPSDATSAAPAHGPTAGVPAVAAAPPSATSSAAPTPTATPTSTSSGSSSSRGSAASSSGPTVAPNGSPYILVIHSNVAAGQGDPGITDGHAWLTLHAADGTLIHSYGLWPDSHPGITAAGLNNGDGSDVRVDYAGDRRLGAYYYAVGISEEQRVALDAAVRRQWCWTITNTCASFASEVFYEVTGIDIDADDYLGFETPREVGEHIVEANGGRATPAGPIQPAPGPAPSSSSSSSSSSK